MSLKVGATAEVFTEVTVNRALTNPSTLELRVRSPSGGSTTYVLGTHPELTQVLNTDGTTKTGHFHAIVPCTAVGRWIYVWTSTGTAAGVSDGDFYVEALLG
jgi:hypothetical protein